ncbi:oxidoreductase domain protein [Actinoplanes sp. N902-109]|nr:oxidoreductase domain protein [Actinoplanes sp. N902-109]
MSPNHLDGFQAVPGVRVTWACDRDPAAARTLAAAGRDTRATTDLAVVLADPDVHSVSVAVDHAQHAAIAAQALRAGKHVLVEKPLAISVEDGEHLVKLAADTGRVLSVVSQHRYDALVRAVRSWLTDGLLGALVSGTVSLQCGRTESYYRDSYWRGTWAGEGGSALVNQGYHALDVVKWLCGGLDVVGAATGATALRSAMETEDTLAAVLRSPGGALVSYSVTVASVVAWRTRITLVGTAGSVVFDLDHPGTLHLVEGGTELLARAATERQRATAEEPSGIDYYGISHRTQIADFCAAVREGTPMVADGAAGLDTLRLLSAMYQAGRG